MLAVMIYRFCMTYNFISCSVTMIQGCDLYITYSLCRAGLYSESQKFLYTIQQRTQGIPDARTYLLTLKEIRNKYVLRLVMYFGKLAQIVMLLCFFSSLDM